MTRGELILVAIIFGLIYSAGLLPKLVTLVAGGGKGVTDADAHRDPKGE